MEPRKRSVSSSATNVSFNHTRSSSISSSTSDQQSIHPANTTDSSQFTEYANRSRASFESINSAEEDFSYWRQPTFYTHHNSSSSSTITGAAHSIAHVGFNTLKKTGSASSAVFAKPTNPLAKLFTKNLSLEKLKSHPSQNSMNEGSTNSNNNTSSPKNFLYKLRKERKRPDLSIQTNFPTMLTDSPLRKTSKELERIASIGTSDHSNIEKSKTPKTPKRLGHSNSSNHHHFLRSNKNNNLSSSNSNSHITGDKGTIYNFHPSTPGLSLTDLTNIILQSENDSFYNLTIEDREQKADDTWSLLYSLVIPLFKGQLLKVPIEDLNKIVLLHLSLRIQEKVPSINLVGEYLEFLQNGLRVLENQLIFYNKSSTNKNINKLVLIWEFFHNRILHVLEGILLPLQLEFEGKGISLRLTEYNDYWSTYFEPKQLSTMKLILTSFRDNIVIPFYDNQFHMNERNSNIRVNDTLENNLILLQCFGILNSIQSGDTNQNIIERQFELVKQQIKVR